MTRRILHLSGSPTSDFFVELSLVYARGCLAALDDGDRYAFVNAFVAPDGRWRFPSSLDRGALAAAEPLDFARAMERIAAERIDVALPQMFCLAGMTDYRALLDVLRIPYLGNPPLQMALAADKAKARAIVAAAGVDVPPGELLRAGERATLQPPVVIKPNTADNSDGVSLVLSSTAYPEALATAFAHAPSVLVERFVPLGREVRCGVVARGAELVCLPLEEYAVDAIDHPIRTHADKLKANDDGLTLVAKGRAQSWIVPPSDPIVPAVWAAAKSCYTALGCEQYGLFDFRIDPAGRSWFLEAGLYCSFAPQSVVVTMMEAAGTPLQRFFAEAVEGVARGPAPVPG